MSETTETKKEKKMSIAQAKKAVIEAIDENQNGEIDIEDIVIKGFKTPGIRIKRENFLRKELVKICTEEVIQVAVDKNPMAANIPLEEIDKIADEVIKFERACVSGISAALGVPGGWAMVATIPADIIQYYAYMLRAAQKLLYLYGFPEITSDEEGVHIDSGTMNILIVCLGVMYGVGGAKNALLALSKALGHGVKKELMKKALTKGTLYPIIKKICKWFSVSLTKEVFTSFFEKAIPLVGGAVGGAITYLSFKPCCDKLKESLQDTVFTNPDRANDCTIIDVEVEEIKEEDRDDTEE